MSDCGCDCAGESGGGDCFGSVIDNNPTEDFVGESGGCDCFGSDVDNNHTESDLCSPCLIECCCEGLANTNNHVCVIIFALFFIYVILIVIAFVIRG